MQRNRSAALRQVAAIRESQCAGAEHQAGQAASAVRARDVALQEAERSSLLVEEKWLQTIAAPSLSTNDAKWWSAQLRQDALAAQQARRDLERAEQHLERKSANWHAAILRRDIAAKMAKDSMKEELRRRDDAFVQEALDRHASRRRSR